jgi:hypothetical protein
VDSNCFFGSQEDMIRTQETASLRTLRRALATVGSEERLAAALQVSVIDLSSWLAGERIAPGEVFIRALDIVARAGRARDPVRD